MRWVYVRWHLRRPRVGVALDGGWGEKAVQKHHVDRRREGFGGRRYEKGRGGVRYKKRTGGGSSKSEGKEV